MRWSGGSSAAVGSGHHQTLSPEAASVLKHSLSLARRRSHAHLTPLHVASTLLSLPSTFRAACLTSHLSSASSQPLQCRALDLCFNVALNRLPTTTPTPTLLLHHQPSLSNALIAALKRAQAHQRRGFIEQSTQQQPLLATVKIELEQLVISILDDPSVSRVMREAGFSSTAVKKNIEESDFSSSSPASRSFSHNMHSFLAAYTTTDQFNPVLFSPPPPPVGGLGLTLHASTSTCVLDSKMLEEQDKLNCCEECASNYEKEAQFLRSGHKKKMLPFWLQPHTTEPHHMEELTELKRKWNRLCQCLHQSKQPQNRWIHPYNSSSSISFSNNAAAKPTYNSNHVPRFRRQQQSCTIEFNFSSDKRQLATEPVLGMEEEGKEVKTTLALGNGGSSSGETVVVGDITDHHRTLRRAHVCKLLQENVPWQSETVPSIAQALIDDGGSKFTWLLLQGNDSIGKRRLALAVAESVFGSADQLFQLDMLKKETSIAPFHEMLAGALRSHLNLVVLIENVDFADAHFMKCLENRFEAGKFGTLGQLIFILTTGGSRRNEEQNHQNKDFVMRLLLQVSETKPNNLEEPHSGHKRKAEELDLFYKIKIPRIEERKEESLVSRQSSFNSTTLDLDLNMKADEEEDDDDDITGGDCSPISSDLTLEAMVDPMNPNCFLDSIENKFVLNYTCPVRDREMAEMLCSKIKGCFKDVCGVNFSVDERVIEEMVIGYGSFTNSMFEKWLKDIFQRSLERVNIGGGCEGIHFRLCLGRELLDSSGGFMSSSLPKSIPVKYFMG